MQILYRSHKTLWWHHKILICDNCGQIVQLEPDDVFGDDVRFINPSSFLICCARCTNRMQVSLVESPVTGKTAPGYVGCTETTDEEWKNVISRQS